MKNRYSCFMNTELDFMLRRLGVTCLVICGTQYPNCIRASIFDAVCHGYRVVNIIDATSAQTPDVAEANIRDNGYEQRCTVQQGDIRSIATLLAPESFDLVVTNPPYRKTETGRLNQDDQSAHARHELQGGIEDFVRAAAFAVKNRGKVVCIYPARRCNTLMAALHGQRLTPKRLQPIYSYPSAASACLVLIEAVKNGGEQLDILAPFFIYQRRNGTYSPAMQALYQEDECLPR